MKGNRIYQLLKIVLFFAACGWGISILGILLPWSIISTLLIELGSTQIIEDPMQIYWSKMVCGGFSFIGILFAYVAINPVKHLNLIKPLGYFSIFEGAVLLINGINLKINYIPFLGDVIFCFVVGISILYLERLLKNKGVEK